MIFADDVDTSLAGFFPAACVAVFIGALLGIFVTAVFRATGFAPRRDGDFLDERTDPADASFFFAVFLAGFLAELFAFDGLLKERCAGRDLDIGRLRADAGRACALRLAVALDLTRDLFTGFEAFLAMIVLLLGCSRLRRAHRCTGISRDWGESGKLQIITCA
jgi:hypothetical protein